MLPRKKGRLLLESINRWPRLKEFKLHEIVLELKATNLALLTFSNMFQLQSVHIQIRQIKHVDKSTGSNTPFGREQKLQISGLEHFRETLVTACILERASKVTIDDTRPCTTSNYESSRHKWATSFGEQKHDMHVWHVNFMTTLMTKICLFNN